MYFPRLIEKDIKKWLDDNTAIVITGMRRTGKTTLLRKIMSDLRSENKIWFDFESPLQTQIFDDIDYNDIYTRIVQKGNLDPNKKLHVFIDEAQNFPQISKIVKYLSDHKNIKFYLTGSVSFYLKNLFPESLAGRKMIFELFPLTFEEFLIFKKANIKLYKACKKEKEVPEVHFEEFDVLYDEYLSFGGFPGVVLESDQDKKEQLLDEIFASYFKNEIIALADFRKNEAIKKLILLLAVRVGSKLDIQKISQELGITRATLYEYLSFLEGTYLIHTLNQYSKSIDRKLSRTKKLYFCDNGLLRIMAQISEGQEFENAVFNQLRPRHKEICYYQRSSGAEIDFIVDGSRAFEVKTTGTLTDVKRLIRAAGHLEVKESLVASKNFVRDQKGIVFGQFL